MRRETALAKRAQLSTGQSQIRAPCQEARGWGHRTSALEVPGSMGACFSMSSPGTTGGHHWLAVLISS